MKSVRKKKTRRLGRDVSGQRVSEVTRRAIGFPAFHARSVYDGDSDALMVFGELDGRAVHWLIQIDNAAAFASRIADALADRCNRVAAALKPASSSGPSKTARARSRRSRDLGGG